MVADTKATSQALALHAVRGEAAFELLRRARHVATHCSLVAQLELQVVRVLLDTLILHLQLLIAKAQSAWATIDARLWIHRLGLELVLLNARQVVDAAWPPHARVCMVSESAERLLAHAKSPLWPPSRASVLRRAAGDTCTRTTISAARVVTIGSAARAAKMSVARCLVHLLNSRRRSLLA